MTQGSGESEGRDRLLTELAGQASAEAGGLPTEWLDGFLPSLVEAALRGTRLDRRELDSTRRLGGEAARAGVPLAGVVDLYLSGARLVWTRLPELAQLTLGLPLEPDDLSRAGAAALQAADDALAAAADGFAATRRVLVRHEEAVRREFVDDLLSGQGDMQRLTGRAEQFGLQLAAPHAVILVDGDRAMFESRSVHWIEDHARSRLRGRDVLVATKKACLVCVVAQPWHDADHPAAGLRAAAHLIADVADELADQQRWRISVGRSHAGATGVSRSYREALDALDISVRLGLDDRIVFIDRLQVFRVLLRDEQALSDLVQTTLAPLAQARGGDVLLETLSAYYASGGVTTHTARRLHLSVRAVTYRLQRIEQVLGITLDDSAHRFALQTAVIGARLLNWPVQSLPPARPA